MRAVIYNTLTARRVIPEMLTTGGEMQEFHGSRRCSARMIDTHAPPWGSIRTLYQKRERSAVGAPART